MTLGQDNTNLSHGNDGARRRVNFAQMAGSYCADGVPGLVAQPTTSIEAQERGFQSGSVTLNGKLYVPKIEGRVPAVIVLHAASAPTRDFPVYRHLTEMLPTAGHCGVRV